MNAVDGGEQQRHGVLRHRIGGVGGHPHHVHPAVGVAHIHVVETGTTHGHRGNAQLHQTVDDGGVYRVVDKGAHPVKAASQIHCVFIQLRFKIFKLDAVFLTVAVK